MHFSGIWRSKFTNLANKTVKKLNFREKNGCKQKCLDKSLLEGYLLPLIFKLI